MRILLLLQLLLSGVWGKRQISGPNDVLLELVNMAAASAGVISFPNTEEYIRYVRAPDRLYNLAILVTAGNKWPCPLCGPAVRAFEMFGAALQREGMQAAEGVEIPFFLGLVDASVNIEIPEFHGVTAVPHVAFLPQRKELIRTPAGQWRFPEVMAPTAGSGGASSFPAQVKATLERWSNKKVELIPSASERAGTIVTILVGIATIAAVGWKLLLLARSNPTAMSVCAILAQYLATTGLVWGLIHGFHSGHETWFLRGNRRAQTAVEGFIMSFVIIACGFCWWVATLILRRPKTTRSDLFWAVALISMGLLLWTLVNHSARWKSGVEAQFWPPPKYVRGPLRHDRGNSF